MGLTPPPELRPGEDIAVWAKRMTRWARQVTPREGADVYPQTNSTGTSYLRRRRGGSDPQPPFPYQVTGAPPPDGQTDDDGPWVQVELNSWLTQKLDPTSKITITGLGLDGKFQITGGPPWHIWLEVDISPLFMSTPGTPTASIKNAADWNPSGLTIFPAVIVWNTDDGTANGSSGTPPSNVQQKTFIVPIAYVISPSGSDPFGLINAGYGLQLSATMTLFQQLDTNLIMTGPGCSVGNGSSYYSAPWWAPMTKADDT